MATLGDPTSKAAYGAVAVLASAATKIPTTAVEQNTLLIQNRGPKSIYVGWDSSVTTSTGVEVPSGGVLNVDVVINPTKAAQPQLYAIADTSDQVSPLDTRYMAVK